MIKTILFLIMLVLLGVFLFVSISNYSYRNYKENKEESYSFLNQFPYELCDESTSKQPLLAKVLIALFGASYSLYGSYTFYTLNMYNAKIMQDYVMGTLLLITGIVIFLKFVWSLKDYNKHLFVTSISFVLTPILYIYLGFLVLSDQRELFHPSLMYIGFIVGGLILISLFILPLKDWMFLKKEETEGIVSYHRDRVSLLPLVEWIFILLDVILAVIIMFY